MNPRGALALLSLAVLAILAGGCAKDPLYRQEAFVFGTRVEVLVWGEPAGHARRAVSEVLREFDRLHRMLHAWEPSEVTRLNDAIARGGPIEISAELARILEHAAAIAAASDQLFNPAIGKLVRLWGFHADGFEPRRPAHAEIVALVRAHPRMSDLTWSGGSVRCANPAVAIDLGGYAKGYALDRAAELLKQRGVRHALVNIGGNVIALGTKGGQPWRIGVQHPRAAGPLALLNLDDGEAIGTSGDYQRYFELDATRYSHLIDPRTGWPARDVQAVTVLVTPRPRAGALSDAASKPLFIAAARDWRDMARRLQVEHVMRIDASGAITVTRAMRGRVEFQSSASAVEVVE